MFPYATRKRKRNQHRRSSDLVGQGSFVVFPFVPFPFSGGIGKHSSSGYDRKLPEYTVLLQKIQPSPAPDSFPTFYQRFMHNNLARQSPTPHIHWEIAIFMQPPPLPKKLKNQKITIDDKVTILNFPAPNASPSDPKYYSTQITVSTVSKYIYSLRNRNQYFIIYPDTKK